MVVLPTEPAESVTVAFSVWTPLVTCLLSHGSVTGPLDVSAVLARFRPPMLSVYVLLPAAARSIHIVVHTAAPLTVAPLVGCVMNTANVGFCTCTYVKLLPVLPVASCTLALIVREPFAAVVVSQFQVTLVVLPAFTVCWIPSTNTVNRLFVPLAPATVICTASVPRTVWPGTMLGKLTCNV